MVSGAILKTARKKKARIFAAAFASLLAAAPVFADEISVEFGRGPGEIRFVYFDDFSGVETWYMTRCQNAVSPDYYVLIREYGEAEQIQPVNSPLEADKTVCVIGRIPDIVKRYMR